jgi:nucleoside-diphosphate-sugar epimerase
MKIAVIGATGFIGSNLIKHLSSRHQIIATYNIKSKIDKNYLYKKNIKWKFLDIHKNKNFFKYLNSPDLVIHLAWSNLPNYQLNFHERKELPNQKKFILDLIKNGLKNIFIAGSCLEYGYQNGKLDENKKEIPNNKFAKAKCKLKKNIFFLQKKYKFNLIWGRIFYIYGKHNTRNTLYNQVINSSKEKNNKIFVSGNKIRDYLHIKKVCQIIINLSLKKINFGLVNICSGKGITLKKLINNICKLENIKPNVEYIKIIKKNIEPDTFWGCNKKLKTCLQKNR